MSIYLLSIVQLWSANCAVAVALEKSNLGNLRNMPHKDQYGNLISIPAPCPQVCAFLRWMLIVAADPDLSNPTRPRLERPLDTIRSFEAAIYGAASSRPASFIKSRECIDHTFTIATDYVADEPSPGLSRRGSYFGGELCCACETTITLTVSSANEYPSRPGASRQPSYFDGYHAQPAETYYPYNNQNYQAQAPRRPRPNRRMTSEQSYPTSSRNTYPEHGYHQSYDNVTAESRSGSGQTEPYGNSTDPSSVNSSLDRLQQQQQQQQQEKAMTNDNGYGYGYPQGAGYGPGYQSGYQPGYPSANDQPPQPPRHVFGTAPVPDPNAGGPVGGQPAAASNRRHLRKSTNMPEAGEGKEGKESKRKSWFKRKFSRS